MARRTLFEARLTQLRHQRWTKADARLVLDALERSGDSVSAFARAHQLSAKKIFWWRNQLTEERDERTEPLSFAPVVVTGLGRSPAVVIRKGTIEIEVLEPSAVEPGWLASVLDATSGGEA